ncbi:MAG TPA: hypothetical protein VFI31_01330 [Pirellulales bacterium]|nr:hypothetical protein [Pirellulales bacterium]
MLAEPAQVVICVARPNRQIVNLVDAWRNRAVDQVEPRVNQSLVVGVRESVEDYREIGSSTVQRLGVMARAAGIFLVFAAQRPEDRVMPVQLRDNLGNRLVLRVESPGTSMIALGEEGAERLLGRGHLAARLQGEDRIAYAQVPMLPAEQMAAIVAAIRKSASE